MFDSRILHRSEISIQVHRKDDQIDDYLSLLHHKPVELHARRVNEVLELPPSQKGRQSMTRPVQHLILASRSERLQLSERSRGPELNGRFGRRVIEKESFGEYHVGV